MSETPFADFLRDDPQANQWLRDEADKAERFLNGVYDQIEARGGLFPPLPPPPEGYGNLQFHEMIRQRLAVTLPDDPQLSGFGLLQLREAALMKMSPWGRNR